MIRKWEMYTSCVAPKTRQGLHELAALAAGYEQGGISPGAFREQTGMTYPEAVGRMYRFLLVDVRGQVRYLRDRGLLTAEACKDILGGEVLKL